MKPKKATPGKGRTDHVPQFTNVKVKPGLSGAFTAWIAGEPYWCEAHRHTDEDPGTKICLHWATDGELHCPRCRKYPKTEQVCYVPFYREEDGFRGFVICHETVHELIAPLVYGNYVRVARVTWDSSIYVQKLEGQIRFATSDESRKRPCDLTPTLLNVWGYPEYDRWLLASSGKTASPAAEVTPAATMKPAPEKPAKGPIDRLREAQQRQNHEADLEAQKIGKTMDFLLNRTSRKNGKHEKRE